MPAIIPCPGCGKPIRPAAEFAGKRVRCPQCGTVFRFPKSDAPVHAADARSAERAARLLVEHRSADSAAGKAFGWGFGLVLGTISAVVLLVASCCGGLAFLTNKAAKPMLESGASHAAAAPAQRPADPPAAEPAAPEPVAEPATPNPPPKAEPHREPTPRPARNDRDWVDANRETVEREMVTVGVKAMLDRVPVKDIAGRAKLSDSDLLMVVVALSNLNPTKKVTYRTWSGAAFALGRDYATLQDEHGNAYKRINFGLGSRPVGAINGVESLYPEAALSDMLVFEAPVAAATQLYLELPAANIGGAGMIRFRIPMAAVKAKPAPEEEARPRPASRSAETWAEREKQRRAAEESRQAAARNAPEAKAAAAERQARLALRLAKEYLDGAARASIQLNEAKARELKAAALDKFKTVVKDYPETEAAKEAQKLLDKWSK